MRTETPTPDPATQPTQTSAETLGEVRGNCRQILANLLEIGNEMAAILAYQMRSQIDDPEAAQKTVAAFTKLAQSARRTILLHEKLGQPKKNHASRIAARKRIIRDVEDAIAANTRTTGEAEKLHAEFIERLDRPDLEEDIAERPTAEIVTDLCRDLGVDRDHPSLRRTPHDIAILNARAAQLPGTPPSAELLALLASTPPRPPDPPAEDYAAMDMKTLMKRAGLLRES